MIKPVRQKKKRRKKNGISFSLRNSYLDSRDEFGCDEARRLRGFIEAEQRGRATWIVDFNLSDWKGWTLWDMSADLQGINTLKWILDKDFPNEIKATINRHLEERGMSFKDDSITVETSDSASDFFTFGELLDRKDSM